MLAQSQLQVPRKTLKVVCLLLLSLKFTSHCADLVLQLLHTLLRLKEPCGVRRSMGTAAHLRSPYHGAFGRFLCACQPSMKMLQLVFLRRELLFQPLVLHL
uniref:Secreted protein n=1 Tax=Pyramimonas obovata TaxID=1411642 RepID=A0A7S0WFX2_9CHLO